MDSPDASAERIVNWLRETPFCNGLAEDQLRELAADVEWRPFDAGHTLSACGDVSLEFWIIVEGEIDSFLTDTRGRESLLGVLRAGDTIGDVSILEEAPRAIRFTARTNGGLLSMPAPMLHHWLESQPLLLRNLYRLLSQKFKRVIGMTQRTLPARRLLIVAGSRRGHVLAGRLAARLLACGERLQVQARDNAALRAGGHWPEALAVHEMPQGELPFAQAPEADYDRRVAIWSVDSGGSWDHRLAQSCDELLWFVDPESADAVDQDLRAAGAIRDELAQKLRLVWLLDERRTVAPIIASWQGHKPPLKASVESTGHELTRLERQSLDRIVRALRGITIGIALAGGGAKGMAHLGVLRALEEAGITFDAMSGTSAGAMAGIAYAAGIAPDYAAQCFERDLTPGRWFRSLPKWPNWYLLSQFRRLAWDGMLRRYFHDWRLEQLPIPFHSVTVDLVQVRPVVRSHGDAVQAILESINLPVLSQPILRDGMALVDGGVLNNLPADVLVEHGADFVVGVDVASRVRHEFAGNRPDTPTDKMHKASTLDTLLRIFESQAHDIRNIRNRAVDFWITPDTSGFTMSDFYRASAIASAGAAAAQTKVAELKQRLDEVERRVLGLPRKAS